jgi:hypothetical protein
LLQPLRPQSSPVTLESVSPIMLISRPTPPTVPATVLQPLIVTAALKRSAIIGRSLIQPNGICHIPVEEPFDNLHKYLDNIKL